MTRFLKYRIKPRFLLELGADHCKTIINPWLTQLIFRYVQSFRRGFFGCERKERLIFRGVSYQSERYKTEGFSFIRNMPYDKRNPV